MMKHIEKVGNIDVYTEKNNNRDYTVTLINGTDIIAREEYFTNNIQVAIENLFSKVLDIYTEDFIFLCVPDAIRLTENTYKTGENDYFCRINNTRYFQHYEKNAEDFIKDKNGKSIIDR